MKKFLILLLLLLPTVTFAQLTTFNPDTVCYQTTGSIYSVNNIAGLNYVWSVLSPGVITSGQGTNQITVNWSSANPGLITGAVSVYATNAAGCQSSVVDLNVFILNVVVAATPISPICETASCVGLSATPNGGIWSGTGINGSQFCPGISGPGQFNLTYTVNSGGCAFTDVIIANVSQQPVLLPIQHN
jgi:hypothetical protein